LIAHPGVVVNEYYQSSESQHLKNERIHVILGQQLVLQLMLNGGKAEKKENILSLWQFSTL
jgi:hypothetical protein